MISYSAFILFLGMALVTFIPRAIPAVFIEKMNFSPKFEKFLKLIPYTAMAALILPGAITADPDRVYIGIIGALVAAVLSYRKFNLIICVLAAIVADFLIYLCVL